jgi:hypothetical protein
VDARGNGGRAEEQASNLQLVVVLQHFVHVVLRAARMRMEAKKQATWNQER